MQYRLGRTAGRDRPKRAAAGLAVALLALLPGCGGGSGSGPVQHAGWSAGKRLADRPNLGHCATAVGPHGRVLIACHSDTETAFDKSCWTPPSASKASLNSGEWTDASNDSNCGAAWAAVKAAGLFGK